MKRMKTVADSLKAAASMLHVDVGTVRAAKASGCPAFRGGRVHLDELRAWLAEVAKRKNAPPGAAPKAGGEETGLEASLKRLASEEVASHAALQEAKARNDLLAIPGLRTGWLQTSEALRKADMSLESARREAGELVPREIAEEAVAAALHYYVLTLRPTLLSACGRLGLPGSQANEMVDALASALPFAVASANTWCNLPHWLKKAAGKAVTSDYGKRAPALVAGSTYVLQLVAGIMNVARHNPNVREKFVAALTDAHKAAGLEMPEPPAHE